MLRLEDIIIERGLITRDELGRALELAREQNRPLTQVLVESGFVTEADLLQVQAERQGLEFVRLDELRIDPAAIKSLPVKLVSHYAVMPIRFADGVVTLAVSSPLDMSAADDIRTNVGCRVERVLACRSDIQQAIRRYYGTGADTVERILARSPDRDRTPAAEESHDLERLAEDASVVRLVNQLFQEAINDRATDIHFEVYRDNIAVRRRIDGALYDTSVPRNIKLLYPAIVSRIKLMSGLDIVERRLPQDGRSRVKIGEREYDLRISVVPSMHGEDVVVRILPSSMLFDLTQLGFSPAHRAMLEEYIARPHGILFVTGPTGSGKSTTLYACLSRLNNRDIKIITIEDPIEYEVRGITQTQIKPGIGLTFGRALRSMLRHDPDVMMVGEVRDRETAEIAVQTAMTGHLVLSTLHTNDSASAAVRLIDMGIDPYLITSTVLAFIAQRLVRLICTQCKETYEENGQTLYRGRGCRHCNQSGYHGRIAICEFLPLLPGLQRMVLDRASAQAIREHANTLGLKTLADDGMEKVHAGLTTLEEVLKVTTL